MERIDIVVDEARLAENPAKEQRLAGVAAFKPTDRVPVVIGTNQWTALAARGRRAKDYFRSPQDNLREQILNLKWRTENILDDQPIPDSITFQPDLGCLRGTEFDMNVTWPDDQPPKCEHPLTEPQQIDDLDVPPPEGGINAKRIAWYHAMVETARDVEVTLNGKPLPLRLTLGQPGGPIPSAFALAGANLFMWMATEPQRVHRLMRLVTESHMRCTRYFDELLGRDPKHPVSLGCDSAEMMGPAMFHEFVVPYYLRIWEAYPGPRGFHNCGKNEHLLDLIRDELRITLHNAFGPGVDPAVLAAKFGGRIAMSGGPDPMLIKTGPIDAIIDASRRYIDLLGPKRGFTLTTGGGAAAPHTPIEHYHAMVEASHRAARN